jgi:hypothetical protein
MLRQSLDYLRMEVPYKLDRSLGLYRDSEFLLLLHKRLFQVTLTSHE